MQNLLDGRRFEFDFRVKSNLRRQALHSTQQCFDLINKGTSWGNSLVDSVPFGFDVGPCVVGVVVSFVDVVGVVVSFVDVVGAVDSDVV